VAIVEMFNILIRVSERNLVMYSNALKRVDLFSNTTVDIL
jgi:hypothetical protein